MADNNFQRKARPKNIVDSKRIALSVPCPVKGVKGFSELHYYAGGDNPGITVYTRDPADHDNNYGRIQAKMGIIDMQIHLEQLNRVCRSKEPVELQMFCKSIRGQDKKRVDVACVTVGKRPDGVVYILVEDLEKPNRPKIHFPFAPTYWHHLGKNGQPYPSEAEASIDCAIAYYNLLSRLIAGVAIATYEHPKPKDFNGGGNRGGGYNGNNNNSNYGGNRGGGGGSGGGDAGGLDFDDDIDF